MRCGRCRGRTRSSFTASSRPGTDAISRRSRPGDPDAEYADSPARWSGDEGAARRAGAGVQVLGGSCCLSGWADRAALSVDEGAFVSREVHGRATDRKGAMATLHIEHPITDLQTWLGAFARFEDARRKAGVRAQRVCQPVDDEKYIYRGSGPQGRQYRPVALATTACGPGFDAKRRFSLRVVARLASARMRGDDEWRRTGVGSRRCA